MAGPLNMDEISCVAVLAGDGSQREFYRVFFAGGVRAVAVVPGDGQEKGMAEARSAWNIGRHLQETGVPVPWLFAFDPGSGLILCEDLGDLRLFDHLRQQADLGENGLAAVYTPVVRELALMQVLGRENFDSSWCWQTERYDRRLMLEKESGYFLAALCKDLLGLDPEMDSISREFADISHQAAAAPADFFLHRDFQSRNIMLKDGRIRIIDFQAGRFGPLGYDLASLLLDPYVGLPQGVQDALFEEYFITLTEFFPYDSRQFKREYFYLSLQRNLQVLGAFAFLSKQKGKLFFRPFIRPALVSLQSLLAKPGQRDYPALAELTYQCLKKADEYDL